MSQQQGKLVGRRPGGPRSLTILGARGMQRGYTSKQETGTTGCYLDVFGCADDGWTAFPVLACLPAISWELVPGSVCAGWINGSVST